MHLKASPSLTIIGVSDTVLEDSVPLLLLLLGHHTEVVVMAVRVPEDQRELGGALKEGWASHLGLHTWKKKKRKSPQMKRRVIIFNFLHVFWNTHACYSSYNECRMSLHAFKKVNVVLKSNISNACSAVKYVMLNCVLWIENDTQDIFNFQLRNVTIVKCFLQTHK